MNLAKLFETQRLLDEHILDEHPELKGQNNLDWKILALQVELGECANEWRGFKKWSNDQEPRTSGGYDNGRKCTCSECASKNPLLEEYVDCIHFILSIGLEFDNYPLNLNYEVLGFIEEAWNTKNTIEQFQVVYKNITDFSSTCDELEYIELVSQFLGLGEMLGFTWEQIEQAYYDKNAINHERQATGY
ncbi:dUTP diphosphatase [Psychrobacillus sp. FSL K6-2365]|uniref:dUTP diphosphatase n=1 Tax=Psychrobacillus sp. FSL K6-2365 TaxID=2921546 RepID=UPI0030F9156C